MHALHWWVGGNDGMLCVGGGGVWYRVIDNFCFVCVFFFKFGFSFNCHHAQTYGYLFVVVIIACP